MVLRAFQTAGEPAPNFAELGGIVLLLSNAPRPSRPWSSQLDGLGVARTAYDAGLTSGDVTRTMIAPWQGARYCTSARRATKAYSKDLRSILPMLTNAEVIVCSGLFDDSKETPQDYAELFAGLVARRVPMICANPDLVVERGDTIGLLRGSPRRGVCRHRRQGQLCGKTALARL